MQKYNDWLQAEVGFRCSAGISSNRMLAKLVSGLHKPDDQTVLLPPDASAFVAPLPIRALPGLLSLFLINQVMFSVFGTHPGGYQTMPRSSQEFDGLSHAMLLQKTRNHMQ